MAKRSKRSSRRKATAAAKLDRSQIPDGFPLWPHPSGRWCKKVRKTACYFGRWDRAKDGDWRAALERFERKWPYLKVGRIPPPADRRRRWRLRHAGAVERVHQHEAFHAGRQRTFSAFVQKLTPDGGQADRSFWEEASRR